MKKYAYQNEIKAIKLLQDRTTEIASSHSSIGSNLDSIKERLAALGAIEVARSPELSEKKDDYLRAMSCERSLTKVNLTEIYQEAGARYQEPMALSEILTVNDWKDVDDKLDRRIFDFNTRYRLDKWDYAIAGSCGLFA